MRKSSNPPKVKTTRHITGTPKVTSLHIHPKVPRDIDEIKNDPRNKLDPNLLPFYQNLEVMEYMLDQRTQAFNRNLNTSTGHSRPLWAPKDHSKLIAKYEKKRVKTQEGRRRPNMIQR